MPLRPTKIRKNSKTFQRLCGHSVAEFDTILQKLAPKWESTIISCYKTPGRNHKLDLSDMILMLLPYYQSYVTQIFVRICLGLMTLVCAALSGVLSLFWPASWPSKRAKIVKGRGGKPHIDATQQAIEHPKKRPKILLFWEKETTQSLKTEIPVTGQGRIVHVSKSHPGSVHDCTVFKSEKRPPKKSRLFVNSGYQGIADMHQNADFPTKGGSTQSGLWPMDAQKFYNMYYGK